MGLKAACVCAALFELLLGKEGKELGRPGAGLSKFPLLSPPLDTNEAAAVQSSSPGTECSSWALLVMAVEETSFASRAAMQGEGGGQWGGVAKLWFRTSPLDGKKIAE